LKIILLVGGAGFIGSSFISYFFNKNQDDVIVNLDKLTYTRNLDNLLELKIDKYSNFVEGDTCNRNLFQKCNITDAIHFVEEHHVDNSITNPYLFLTTKIKNDFKWYLEVGSKKGIKNTINRYVEKDKLKEINK